jgi:hypothetical protein
VSLYIGLWSNVQPITTATAPAFAASRDEVQPPFISFEKRLAPVTVKAIRLLNFATRDRFHHANPPSVYAGEGEDVIPNFGRK